MPHQQVTKRYLIWSVPSSLHRPACYALPFGYAFDSFFLFRDLKNLDNLGEGAILTQNVKNPFEQVKDSSKVNIEHFREFRKGVRNEQGL